MSMRGRATRALSCGLSAGPAADPRVPLFTLTRALPVQTYIETVVHEELRRWFNTNMLAPQEITIQPTNFQPKEGLTDEDLEKAVRAAELAMNFSSVNLGS